MKKQLHFGFFIYHRASLFSTMLRLDSWLWCPLTDFLITLTRHTTFSIAPLDERSARGRDLYLTTHNTHKRETSIPPTGFESTIPSSERAQTYALDLEANGIGPYSLIENINCEELQFLQPHRRRRGARSINMLKRAEILPNNLTGTYSIVGNYESCDHTGISDSLVIVLTDHKAIKVSTFIIQPDRDPQLCA